MSRVGTITGGMQSPCKGYTGDVREQKPATDFRKPADDYGLECTIPCNRPQDARLHGTETRRDGRYLIRPWAEIVQAGSHFSNMARLKRRVRLLQRQPKILPLCDDRAQFVAEYPT